MFHAPASFKFNFKIATSQSFSSTFENEKMKLQNFFSHHQPLSKSTKKSSLGKMEQIHSRILH